jgi:predicted transcriptional regulator
MGRMKKPLDGSLTPLELEIMMVLWRLGSGSVHDVLSDLATKKDLAYTTVSTVLRLLEKKEVVESLKDGRTHIYVPLLSKEDYESHAVSQVVTSVFEGTPSMLVKRLLDEDSFSEKDLLEIRRMLDEKQGR